MSKYSKMVESNQKASKEKIDYAIWTIKERQNELIKIEYEKSQKEKLKKALKRKEVAFIKGL